MRGCCALAVAALALPPNYVNFESDYPSGLFDATTSACSPVINTTPPGQNHILQTLCQPTLRLTFARPQASVELFAKTVDNSPELIATAHTPSNDVSQTVDGAGAWKPIVLAAPGGAASITSVDLSAPGHDLAIDSLALSEVPQPDTEIVARPDPSTPVTTAAFTLSSNVHVSAFRCSLDAATFGGCGPFGGVGIGGHTLAAAAVDDYGASDPTPATYSWTVVVPPPRTEASLQGASVVFSSPDNAAGFECSVDGGAFAACSSPFAPGGTGAHTVVVRAVGADGQVDTTGMTVSVPADNDHDNIPDANEKLPLADHNPEVGETTIAQHDGGTVLVQLPGARTFLPFTGAASLPVGSVVDATKGTLTLTVASNGYATTDRRYRQATVTLSGGLFEILQARMRRGVTRVVQIPVEFVLKSAPGAELPCRRAAPSKGVVRTLTAIGKGVFRVTGGASRADVRTASFTTTDRCDGTATRVAKGRVTLSRKKGGRKAVIRAGHRYFVRLRLFTAQKGRGRA